MSSQYRNHTPHTKPPTAEAHGNTDRTAYGTAHGTVYGNGTAHGTAHGNRAHTQEVPDTVGTSPASDSPPATDASDSPGKGGRAHRRFPARAVLYSALPLISQAVIVIYAMQQGQWIMAVTGMPMVLGYLAQVFPSIDTAATPVAEVSAAGISVSEVLGSPFSDSGQKTADSADVEGIPLGEFYDELGLNPYVCSSQLWRRLVGIWLSTEDRSSGISEKHPGRNADHVVPIGLTAYGSLAVSLPKHGPHALVAGTTGSGKSVLLRHWCLALASRHPPNALNLVLLDFKGGAAFRTLAHLPHTVGCVSDLDLAHALRALNGIEEELRRRELLLHRLQVSAYEELDDPPARVVIVVDEFHALRQHLPDAEERLGRIASLGRSLGMHIILSTQNPLGQISTQIKANIALRICLRMQDTMQSIDVLGDSIATALPGKAAGYAYCRDADGIRLFRSLKIRQPEHLIESMNTACRFLRQDRRRQLFTPPLPHLLHTDMLLDDDGPTIGSRVGTKAPTARIGLQDDCVRTQTCTLRFDGLNVAVIGPPGSGKSSLIAVIAAALRVQEGVDVLLVEDYDDMPGAIRSLHTSEEGSIERDCDDAAYGDNNDASMPHTPILTPPPSADAIRGSDSAERRSASCRSNTVVLLDTTADTSRRFDHPLATREAQRILKSDDISVIFTCESMSQLPQSEYFRLRIIFPTGEHGKDVMSGIPPRLLSVMQQDEIGLPGRGFIIRNGHALALQCALYIRPDTRPSTSASHKLV